MAFEASTGLAAKRAAMDTPASPQEVQATVDSPPPAPLEGTPEPADPAPTKDIPGDHDSVGASSPASTVPAGDAKVTVDDKGNQVPFKVLLTQDQALEIYKVRPMDNSPNAKPTSMDVAEQYGVSPKTVRDVWNRKTWVKVTKPLWAAGELELFLSESVRRGPGGRQPSPHGEDGEENEDGRSRRPVREARLNKRVLEAPAEEATVAKATTPRKTNPKKASKAGLAIAPPNAKRPKLSINTAPGSPVVLSGVSPGAMQRVRGGAGPKGGGKKNLHVFMPFSDIYQGQMHSSVHGDELDARALRPTDHWGGGGIPSYGYHGGQPSGSTPSTVPAGGAQHSSLWEPFRDSAELLSNEEESMHSLQEKDAFEFESSPCNVDLDSAMSCGAATDTVSYMSLAESDLVWCE